MKDRAYRREVNNKIIKKRLRLLKVNDDRHPDITGKTYYQKMVEEPHRLVKKHPYDCGNPKCMLCHMDKLLKNKKISDLRKETGGEIDEQEML